MTIAELMQSRVASVNPQTGADAAKKIENGKLKDAAEQFEAIFLQELLKPMQTSSGDGMSGKDEDATPGSDTMSSFGTEAVAKAIAKGGGLGIAKQIIQKVSLERSQHETARV